MISLNLKVSDNDILKKITQMKTVFIPESMGDGIEEFIIDVIEEAQQYPPETEANNPPPPYYQRGEGYFGRTGKLTKPSQLLSANWQYEIKESRTGTEGVIKNVATYSGYVQDEDQQVPWHARTGWKPIQQIVRENRETGAIEKITNKIQSMFDRIFG